jgi:hypothetical protein
MYDYGIHWNIIMICAVLVREYALKMDESNTNIKKFSGAGASAGAVARIMGAGPGTLGPATKGRQ